MRPDSQDGSPGATHVSAARARKAKCSLYAALPLQGCSKGMTAQSHRQSWLAAEIGGFQLTFGRSPLELDRFRPFVTQTGLARLSNFGQDWPAWEDSGQLCSRRVRPSCGDFDRCSGLCSAVRPPWQRNEHVFGAGISQHLSGHDVWRTPDVWRSRQPSRCGIGTAASVSERHLGGTKFRAKRTQ